jgi:radical SAM protein with 4Fe4S-binding SPASM domain
MDTAVNSATSTLLVRSELTRVVSHGERAIVYHSLRGKPYVGHADIQLALEEFAQPRTIAEAAERLGFEPAELAEALSPLMQRGLLVTPGADERAWLAELREEQERRVVKDEARLGVVLDLSRHCNFDCPHCINTAVVKAEEEKGHSGTMSWETAREAVDAAMSARVRRGKTIGEIGFGGGEALLNWRVMKQVMEYATEKYPSLKIYFVLNTNASLVTDEIAQTLARFDVRIATSIDGDLLGNDLVRVDHSGKGTITRIMAGLERLAAAYGRPVAEVTTTMVDGNFDHLHEGFLDFVAARGVKMLGIEPDMLRPPRRPIPVMIEKLLSLLDGGEARGMEVAGRWRNAYDNIFSDVEESGALSSCNAMSGAGFFIQPSGQLRTCSYSFEDLGHFSKWDEIRTSEKYRSTMRNRWSGGITPCTGCPIEGHCKGGCFVTFDVLSKSAANKVTRKASGPAVTAETSTLPRPLGDRCDFYREMTEALLKRMLVRGRRGRAPATHSGLMD